MNATKRIALFFVTLFLLASSSYAQHAYEGGIFDNFGVSLKGGVLYGGGIDVSTSLHSNLKLRIGYNYFGIDAAKYIDTNGDVDLNKASANFSNANVLIDYFPVKKGIFHLTTGLYFGHNKLEFKGSGLEDFAINDYVISPKDGKFGAEVKFGSSVKPYFGIGLGRTITKSRVGFKFELGAVYQGSFKVSSPQLEEGLDGSHVDDSIDIDALESKFWPMMTFSISYRIK